MRNFLGHTSFIGLANKRERYSFDFKDTGKEK